MNIFVLGFVILILLCAILYFYAKKTVVVSKDESFRNFQRTYLIVYLLATASDWLQGPYVYALYQSYGMSSHDIELLFVFGFGSSMIFGTVVGSVADKYGRRANCVLYGVLYGLCCVTKHFNNFKILLVGRLLGGVATSILYSAFESWLILEHHKRGYDPSLLASIFGQAVFGNSMVAIVAGVVSQKAADLFGFVAPFDVSMVCLVIMMGMLMHTWVENYGDQTATTTQSFSTALHAIKSDKRVLCLGLIQSLFEGAMYTFVLEWTPALAPSLTPTSNSSSSPHGSLEEKEEGIPHGIIFAAFMVSVMIGSYLFDLARKTHTIESFMRPVLLVAAASLATPIFFQGNQLLIFTAFLVFECCVGVFWPSMSSMRDAYVPENTRATIMNIFRIPLNFIVIFVLIQNFSRQTVFSLCTFFLLLAFLCQLYLHKLISGNKQQQHQLLPINVDNNKATQLERMEQLEQLERMEQLEQERQLEEELQQELKADEK